MYVGALMGTRLSTFGITKPLEVGSNKDHSSRGHESIRGTVNSAVHC